MTLWADAESALLRARYLTEMGVVVVETDFKQPVTWACGCTRRDLPDGRVYSNSFTVCARHEAVIGVTPADFVEDDDTP
jgi:hypothetical protein